MVSKMQQRTGYQKQLHDEQFEKMRVVYEKEVRIRARKSVHHTEQGASFEFASSKTANVT